MTTLGPQKQGHLAPHFLPDGRRFLFYVRGTADTAGIYLGSLDGNGPTRLTVADTAGYISARRVAAVGASGDACGPAAGYGAGYADGRAGDVGRRGGG